MQGCGIEKDWSLFPEHTSKNGLPQKTCQECQNETKAKRRAQIESGEREVGEGMAFHTPIVDGKKQCRQCEEWKPNDYDHFMTRAATNGFFNECRDCRRENARRYAHATWNAIHRERRRDRWQTDEEFRITCTHRGRVYAVVCKEHFTRSRFSDEIGCTGHELRAWLEYQFDPDMSWQNYGFGKVWSIDHIIPLDKFDLLNPSDRRIAFSWTNMQPCKDNAAKGNSLRLYEVMNAVVSSRRFLRSRNCSINRYHVVGDMLNWLKGKIEI